jgi:hypothetical protein
MENEWERDHVVRAHQKIASQNIELVPLTSDTLDAAADLRAQYEALNVFDGVHLGGVIVLNEPMGVPRPRFLSGTGLGGT